MKLLKVFLLLCCLNFIACQQDGGGGSTPGSSDNSSTGGTDPNFKLTCAEAQFIGYLNLYRTTNARSQLKVSKAGVLAGRWHAQNMIDLNYFSHTEPNGRDFSTRLDSFGYRGWAENIAAGNADARGTFCQWKNSAGHNTNMLNPSHKSTGIGRASGGNYGTYWSSSFGDVMDDQLVEPLTDESACVIPAALPSC